MKSVEEEGESDLQPLIFTEVDYYSKCCNHEEECLLQEERDIEGYLSIMYE